MLDPVDTIFTRNGVIDYKYTYDALRNAIGLGSNNAGFVLPGFYGFDLEMQRIVALPRGASDISGAILATAVDAILYENWTDVDGKGG